MSAPYSSAQQPPEPSSDRSASSGLSGMPAYRPTHAEQTSPVRRPRTVLAGLIMTYVGVGLLVLCVLSMFTASTKYGGGDSSGFLEFLTYMFLAAVRPIILIGPVGALFYLAAMITAAVFAQKGRNGGRIALTVIGGVNMLFDVPHLGHGLVLVLPPLVYIGVAVVLLWVGGANAWYREHRAARRAGR